MNAPTTPSKADDPIEKVKQSLATQWGLRFAPRDPVASPSKRNPSAVDERIHAYIRFLYYNKTFLRNSKPLEYAIGQFAQVAPAIISEWSFKPRAETGVLPTYPQTDSLLRSDFVRRRDELDPGLANDLMLRLEHVLGDVARKIRGSHSFQQPEPGRPADPVAKSNTGKKNMPFVKVFSTNDVIRRAGT